VKGEEIVLVYFFIIWKGLIVGVAIATKFKFAGKELGWMMITNFSQPESTQVVFDQTGVLTQPEFRS